MAREEVQKTLGEVTHWESKLEEEMKVMKENFNSNFGQVFGKELERIQKNYADRLRTAESTHKQQMEKEKENSKKDKHKWKKEKQEIHENYKSESENLRVEYQRLQERVSGYEEAVENEMEEREAERKRLDWPGSGI
jgi:hypothetical protein